MTVTRLAHIGWLLLLVPYCATAQSEDDSFEQLVVDFELADRNGRVVRAGDYKDRYVLLTFGFTHCHHVCPTIAANMARALRLTDVDALGIFVSVDSERDTPETTDDYARRFGDRMHGLGGSYAQVSAAAQNFGVTFVVTKSESTYTVQHTPSIFLIGKNSAVIDVFAINTPAAEIAAAMR